jgi:hypothetical protein
MRVFFQTWESKVIATLDDLGIERMQSSRFQKIAQVPDDRSHSAIGAALLAPAVVVEIGGAVVVVVSGAAGAGGGGVDGGAVVPALFFVSGDPYSGSVRKPDIRGECCR